MGKKNGKSLFSKALVNGQKTGIPFKSGRFIFKLFKCEKIHEIYIMYSVNTIHGRDICARVFFLPAATLNVIKNIKRPSFSP